jgi:hypothetical protein
MSKERKRGLPSDGELTDDKLEISGGAGGDAAQNVGASVAVRQSSSDASSNIMKGVDQETGAGGAGWG